MLRLRRRIENLEDAILPVSDPDFPNTMEVRFVNPQMEVVDTLTITFAPTHPSGNRWRGGRTRAHRQERAGT
jgi:hypothetical protein